MTQPLSSMFLGPAGENADLVEGFILEAFRDHVFWRRNFHPGDGPYIHESEKRSSQFDEAMTRLRQELYYLLSRLKQGAPLFSPRYVAHMTTDVAIASLVGYFAAMLYNPNNISEEASPVTTELELEVGKQLARLVGYGDDAWGHLTSGGSVANLEALWAVRAVKYFPPAAWLVAKELDLRGLTVMLADGPRDLRYLSPWQLMNLSTEAILDLRDQMQRRSLDEPQISDLLSRYSLGTLGYLGFHRLFEYEAGARLPEPVLLVPGTKHYSWVKTADLLGMGQHQLVELALDEHYRIDPDGFRCVLEDLISSQVPVLSLVAVLGSTETGSVDALERLVAIRDDVAQGGMSFYVHVDGAYGGYATAMFRDPEGRWVWTSEDGSMAQSFGALPRTDSVTIDPHKLGYAPYPAGALVFRDQRIREFLVKPAPYVFHEDEGAPHTIGKYIVEGSKPGAAAAAVWLNHRVIPLDVTGYGALIRHTVDCARDLWAAFKGFRSARGFRLIPLNEPDLNLVTFIAVPPVVASLEELNRFNEELYRRFAVDPHRLVFSYDFVLSKTEFEIGTYEKGLRHRLGPELARELAGGSHMTGLRSTIMNPFVPGAPRRGPFFQELLAALDRAMGELAGPLTAPVEIMTEH